MEPFEATILRQIVIWTMLAEPWVTFGGLGGSLEGLGPIFNGFWAPFWSPLGHHFQKNRDLDNAFSTHVFGIVPGGIFNGFWVFPIASSQGKFIEIHATVVTNQGSKDLRTRWFRGASGVDFSWILASLWDVWRSSWTSLEHRFCKCVFDRI